MMAAPTAHELPAAGLDTLDWLAQRCAAAEELWALGYTPESYAILRHGLRDAAALLRGSSDVPQALLHEVDGLLLEADALGAPLSRGDFGREHAAWLERARTVSYRLQRLHAKARGRRSRSMSWWAIACAVLIVAAAFAFRAWERRTYAFASATYASEHAAINAVDGHRATEWLLPDGKTGHLDISLATRRDVHEVTIVNAHNRHYRDRAVKRALVLVFDDRKQVDRSEVTFQKIDDHAEPERVVLKGHAATRVRIVVLEHFGLGGGLAEVTVD